MANLQSNRVINEEELFFLKFLENDNDTDSSCCSSITNSEDDAERFYEATACRVDQVPRSSNSVTPQEILRWKERDRVYMQRAKSEPTNFIGSAQKTNSVMRSKDEGLSHMKQVRWADALVDVHTYISPRSHVLWKKLRKKVAKAAESLKQDIEF